jgi:hypothetical protein
MHHDVEYPSPVQFTWLEETALQGAFGCQPQSLQCCHDIFFLVFFFQLFLFIKYKIVF